MIENVQVNTIRLKFFTLLFGESEGFICIAYGKPKPNKQEYFSWPDDADRMLDFIETVMSGNNVYFCPQLLTKPIRKKENVGHCTALWADLDTCTPDKLDPMPLVVVESSPKRYHGYWPLSQSLPGPVAEDICKRIAYAYAEYGVDKSGWDLTQLLRVPYTYNYKYDSLDEVPTVTVKAGSPAKVSPRDFDALPVVLNGNEPVEYSEIPKNLPTWEEIESKYIHRLSESFFDLHDNPPPEDADWSKRLWRLYREAYEAGLTKTEVFVAAKTSGTNKWDRDNLPELYLWYDVLRAEKQHEFQHEKLAAKKSWHVPEFLPVGVEIPQPPEFVNKYVNWASKQTDAAVQYHEASAFVMLSTLLSGNVKIPTSIGAIRPNIWVMLLADTTLTRKTTAMDFAMDMINEVVDDAVLATDGSIEGLLSALSVRPGKPSVFLRDEVTGFMDSVARKDYMAGTLETLTKLYDNKPLKRVLKKETISINDPVVVVYAGGIRSRMQEILQDSHVASGFIPRFLVVSAVADISKMRKLSRTSQSDETTRSELIAMLLEMRDKYCSTITMNVSNTEIVRPNKIEALIDDDAFELYNEIELRMLEAGYNSPQPESYTPVLDRMCKSMLKIAALIACCRQDPTEENTISVSKEDMMVAAHYTEKWSVHMVDLLQQLGKSYSERLLDKVLKFLKDNEGINRGGVMTHFRLSKFEMDNVQSTLEDRGLIKTNKQGKGVYLWTI